MTDLEALEAKVRSLENETRQLRATLRDKYAASALDGLLAYGWGPEELVAEKAFKIADLMHEARQK